VERSIAQLDGVITDDVRNHLYYRPILNIPADFPEADRKRLAAAYTKMIEAQLNPAHRRLRDFLRNDYLPAAGDQRASATCRTAPRPPIPHPLSHKHQHDADEIFTLRGEVARIGREMERSRTGWLRGDLRAFLDHVLRRGDAVCGQEQVIPPSRRSTRG
jgi:uncharacterized protein (DUF885 family)